MLACDTSLSMITDVCCLVHLVSFPWLSLQPIHTEQERRFKKNISSLLRLIKYDCIVLYANQSTIADCIKYIDSQLAKNKLQIIKNLFDIVNLVPSHFDNNEQLLQEALKFRCEVNELSFDESLVLTTARRSGFPYILTHREILLQSIISSPSREYSNVQVFDINTLMTWIEEQDEFRDFLNTENMIKVFTREGEEIYLRIGSTPVDFAYHIHEDIGHSCYKAIVNGRELELSETLQNGDRVEILRKSNLQPETHWLRFVVTSRAKKYIRQWYRDFYQNKGKELWQESFVEQKITPNGHISKYVLHHLNNKENHLKLNKVEDLYEKLGSGELDIEQVTEIVRGFTQSLNRLGNFRDELESKTMHPPVLPTNETLLSTHFHYYQLRRCCTPFPDQSDILGFLFTDSQGNQGLRIHTCHCTQLSANQLDKAIQLRWNTQYCTVVLKVRMKDRRFILNALLNKLYSQDFKVDVRTVNPIDLSSSSQQKLSITVLNVLVHSTYDLDRLICEIEEILDIQSVTVKQIYPGMAKLSGV